MTDRGKRPLDVEFLQRERDAILSEWRSRLETTVNSHFFRESTGVAPAYMERVFGDIVSAVDKNLYRNLNDTIDTLVNNGHRSAANSLPVSNARDFIFQFVPAARTVLEQSKLDDQSNVELIYSRLKTIEQNLKEVYSGRLARNLLQIMTNQREHVLERWAEDLPTPIISDHFSVLDSEDRLAFLETTYDIILAMLRGEEQEMMPQQPDSPPRNRLQHYLVNVVEYYEPKGFLISDMQRVLSYPQRLLEPYLFKKLNHSISDYRVALVSLVDIIGTLIQAFSEAYSERQMKNYYNEVSIMLHRIKNKLTAVPTTMQTILMIPPDETEPAGDPMVLTTSEAEVLTEFLARHDSLVAAVSAAIEEAKDAGAKKKSSPLEGVLEVWKEYQSFLSSHQAVLDNARMKVDPGSVEMINELLDIVYDGGKMTNELALELQIRQNELYQREPPKRKELDIYTLVRKAWEEGLPEASSRSQKYHLIAEDEGVYVFGVEAELKRPFIQIIENAIKYTPIEGEITVTLRYEPHHVLFSVKDTGIGIPPGEEDLVFGLCERCSNAKDFNKAGTGTGLYNDRKIILHHNGQIWVESEGVGKGSTFFIRLPVHRKIEREQPHAQTAAAQLTHSE